MAQASLVAAVLLLALIANYIDCTTSRMIIEYNCNDAEYRTASLVEFTEHCAPKAWEDFFRQDNVTNAIEMVDKYIKQEHTTAQGYRIEPPMQLMFEAFKRVRPEDVKVVILGQDPTPQEGKATGRAFSVEDPRTVGSVMNVLLEVAYEGWSVDLDNGDLSKWEAQGVLLLNSALTIGEIAYEDEKGEIKTKEVKMVSHLSYWCPFTKLLIQYIDKYFLPSVWMLWGKVAQDFTVERKFDSINKCFNQNQASNTNIKDHPSLIKKGYILTGGHPSPLGGAKAPNTFFAGGYFYCANIYLYETRKVQIDWSLWDGKKGYQLNNKIEKCPPINVNKNKKKQQVFMPKRK